MSPPVLVHHDDDIIVDETMLRAMEPGLGLRFVNEADEVTGAAWAFVGLNVLLALYFANAFLLAPLQNSAALVAGSGT